MVDYDVCSNWGNWNYVAGIGNDPRENRYFNVIKQGKNYDVDGIFMKHWLPELDELSTTQIHQLVKYTPMERRLFNVDYPLP